MVLVISIFLAVYLASFLPTADWQTFYLAARSVLGGHSPYEQPLFMLPPWGILPLLPMALLPFSLSKGLMFVVSLLILVYIMWRLQMPLLGVVAFLLSPTVIGGLLVNNVDPMVAAGMLFPPAWGLFFLLAKPQIGLGVALFSLVEAWQKQGLGGVLKTFAPLGAVYLLSALLFPVWIERMLFKAADPWNRSIFPYAIPLGIFLMWLAFRRHNPWYALAAAPFFAPYHTFFTYMVVQIGLMHPDVEHFIRRDVVQISLCVFFWAIMLTFHLG